MHTVTAWSNGSPTSTGSGYGLRIPRHLVPTLASGPRSVVVILPDGSHRTRVQATTSTSFFRHCPELRSAEIGRWLIRHGLHQGGRQWKMGQPPRFVAVVTPGKLVIKSTRPLK